jgi:transcriptional regulator
MYVPKAFTEDRLDVLHAFIRQHNFATLVSGAGAGDAPLVASHVPVLLDAARGRYGTLQAHLARANPHGEQFTHDCGEVLAIFLGPHGYVSPRWYAKPLNVPTWNFIAVHAYGLPRVMPDGELARHLEAIADAHEPPAPDGWDVRSLPGTFLEKMRAQVVGVEGEITRIEGKWKLGQNRTAEDRAGAVAGLRASGTPEAAALADAMKRAMG